SFVVMLMLSGGQKSTEEATGSEEEMIRLAHTGSDTHQYTIASKKWKKRAEDEWHGNTKVKVHREGSLGGEGGVVAQTRTGTTQMTTVAAESNLSNTMPEMNLFGIPYLVDSKKDVYTQLDGKPGKDLLELAKKKDIKGLGYWEVGFRHFTNKKREIKHPEDMENLKLRVQSAKVWNEHLKTLNAIPTPISFSEL